MSDTTFVPGTVITKEWLNDVNSLRYGASDATKGSALLQYVPEGSGAVPTDVQTKLREVVVTVGDYRNSGDPDDSLSFVRALASGATRILVVNEGVDLVVNTPVTITSPVVFEGVGLPVVKSTVDGTRILGANGVQDIQIFGIIFEGSNSSTVPTDAVSGTSAINNGLVTLFNCPQLQQSHKH